jgi:hypothetical protein
MRKLFTGLLLSMLLLLTQQGAVLHELGHLSAAQTQTDPDQDHPGAAVLCATHLTFAAPGHAALRGNTPAGLTPRSRGPPTRL